jgi:hypothetical protein
MSAIAGSPAGAVPAKHRSLLVSILVRVPMVMLSVVCGLIARRYLVDPVAAGQAAGISFISPGGVIVAQVGFGAFPLAFAAFFLSCVLSPNRILTGLKTELTLLGFVIVIRIAAMTAMHSTETAKLLVPEVVASGLCLLAIHLQRNRERSPAVSAV